MVSSKEVKELLTGCPDAERKTLFFPVMFVGNGINRVTTGISWESLLSSQLPGTDESDSNASQGKPFPLLYEELLARAIKTTKNPHLKANSQVASVIRSLKPNEFHESVMRISNIGTIITTNYDFCLEQSVGELPNFDTRVKEARYNLFRRGAAIDKDIWHIHGRHDQIGTITLGFDHYAGYLQKLRNYATSGISVKGHGKLRSPVASGRRYFELQSEPYSWLDVFLRHDVHIFGFGFDYSELDIWWALVFKHQVCQRVRMRPIKGQVGTTNFYYPKFSEEIDSTILSKISLLESFGVNVVTVDTPGRSYIEFYNNVIDRLSKVPKYRWADVPLSNSKSRIPDEIEASKWLKQWEGQKAQMDLCLPTSWGQSDEK